MKKTAFFILVNLFSLTALLCQTLSKEETLNYIQRIYRKTNCFYLSTYEYNGSNSTYMNFPVGIDQVELEFDQLIIHYNIPREYNAYSGPRSASISGELILDEENLGDPQSFIEETARFSSSLSMNLTILGDIFKIKI